MSQVIFQKASPQKVCEGFGENMLKKESFSCNLAKEVEESFDWDPVKRLEVSEDGNHSKVMDDV